MKKDYLTPKEFDQFYKACSLTSYPARNRAIILLTYRHGLRVSELCNLKVSDLDLKTFHIRISRLKNGVSNVHPLKGDEVRAIKAYLSSLAEPHTSGNLFLSERGPFTRFGVHNLVSTLATLAKLPFHVHPHMLRHSTGYAMVNKGLDLRLMQDYLGHRAPSSTVRYTAVNSVRFEKVWD